MTCFSRPRYLLLASVIGMGVSVGDMAKAIPPVLQPEQSDVASLPPMGDHSVLVATGEQSFTLYDGDKGRILGTLPAEMVDNIAIAPDRKDIYVAVTMWSRGDHGTREDFLRDYDAHTLDLTHEIELPPRGLAVFKQQNLELSQDGHWAFVFDMSPATGVTVVDLHEHKAARTVDIPGCALIFPWAHDGFSTICGDGSLTNVALAGNNVNVTHSKPFFDANRDPVFEQSQVDRKTGKALFISYTGQVYPVTLGATPVMGKTWSLQAAAGQSAAGTGQQEQAWRPGGDQPFAWHEADNRLYVLMHVGGYWTHKQEGTEVWVYDVTTQHLLQRIDLPSPAKGITVSPDTANPQIYAMLASKKMAILSATTGQAEKTVEAKASGISIVPQP
ncbi:methylamine dehydrogenase heavy chain precursor [Komagataeibacter europaeus]|uniref:Methylamine dehydrogenase heavy chain n=1 Tax=Komagataeibacter europaeus TaxID=33995 RepID=A0A0M0EHG6_KOMEU|nr:amine dehydrogenase large subunit [Komagataeibacter europaeus]KON64675.1 methylamine dehydrogenase heavy chain precursor [Komagataeibacter europaeus]